MKVIAAFLILFTVTNSATTISFEVPVEGDAQIVSEFGERTHPVLQTTRSHDGIDYKVSKDSKIVASSSGIIKSVRFLEDEGYSIIIKHDKGLETHYSHLQSVSEDLVVGVEILQRDFWEFRGNPNTQTCICCISGFIKMARLLTQLYI